MEWGKTSHHCGNPEPLFQRLPLGVPASAAGEKLKTGWLKHLGRAAVGPRQIMYRHGFWDYACIFNWSQLIFWGTPRQPRVKLIETFKTISFLGLHRFLKRLKNIKVCLNWDKGWCFCLLDLFKKDENIPAIVRDDFPVKGLTASLSIWRIEKLTFLTLF